MKVIAYGCGGAARRLGIRRRRGARRHERARRRRDEPHRRRDPERSLVEGETRPFRPALRPRRAATRHSARDPGAEARQPHLLTPEGRRHHRLPRGRTARPGPPGWSSRCSWPRAETSMTSRSPCATSTSSRDRAPRQLRRPAPGDERHGLRGRVLAFGLECRRRVRTRRPGCRAAHRLRRARREAVATGSCIT